MKNRFVIMAALLFVLVVAYQKHLTFQIRSLQEAKPPYELGKAMGYLQRFTEKLYWAGEAQNWELANFYAHETEEILTEIIEHKPIKKGKEIAPLVMQMAVPALENVEKAIEAADSTAFLTAYKSLIQTCNACHSATEHGFIRLQVPSQNGYQGQNFSPTTPKN
jgi:hypothetical protein